MTFDQFVEYMKEHILEEWMEESETYVQEVIKNNGVSYTALYIKRTTESCTPAINLNIYYEYYKRGEALEDIKVRIRDEYRQAMRRTRVYDMELSRFQYIKDHIVFRLVNYEKNAEILRECPFIRLYDLAVTFRWVAFADSVGVSTALISNREMELWDVSIHDLLLVATENTERLFPPRFISMDELLLDIGHIKIGAELQQAMPMYIMTNQQEINGATVLLYENKLRDFADQLETDFYLLPSSLHEMILVPVDTFTSIPALFSMVKEANDTVVALGDILSDSVYYYSRKENRVLLLENPHMN